MSQIVKPARWGLASRALAAPEWEWAWDGLLCACIPYGRAVVELVGNRVFGTSSVIDICDAGAGLGQFTLGLDVVTDSGRLSQLNLSQQFSVMVVCASTSYGADDVVLSIRNAASVVGLWSFVPFDTSSSGRYELYYDSGQRQVGTTLFNDGRAHVFHFTQGIYQGITDQDDTLVVVDGWYRNAATGSTLELNSALTAVSFGAGTSGTTRLFDHIGGKILGAFIWARPHTDAQIQQLARDPFGPFRMDRRVLVAVSAATTFYSAVCAITGTATVTAAATVIAAPHVGASAMTATGTVAVTEGVIRPAACAMTGSGTVTSAATAIRSAMAGITGVGTITAVATAIRPVVVSMTGSGTVTAAATVVTNAILAACAMTGSGTVTASATGLRTAAVTLTGAGTVTVDTYVFRPATAALAGSGLLSASAAVGYWSEDDVSAVLRIRRRRWNLHE